MAAALAALLLSGAFVHPAMADSADGDLYYTTFTGGVNVHTVHYNYDGASTFSLTNNTGLASTNGADGILFAPNGNLLVGGQGFNLNEVKKDGTIVTTVNPGNPSFHLALTSNASNALVYNVWNGSGGAAIGAVQLSGGGLLSNGVAYTVRGTNTSNLDVRGVIYNPSNGNWYYGTAPDGGSGDFGTVVFNDVAHTATLTRLQTGLYAHGLSYDPFTQTVIVNSANYIQQLDGAGNILSFLTGNGPFDQAAEDGKGHLFAASNSGYLQFVDYDATGLIGAGANFTDAPFLANNLDDIAPLSGLGSNPVPEPATNVLMGSGLLALAAFGLLKKRLFA